MRRALDGSVVCLAAIGSAMRNARRGAVTVRAHGTSVVLRSDQLRGYWEIEFARRTERPFLSALVDEVDAETVLYDVGANVGFYSCLLARRAATVHAFEPNPHAVADLRRNVSINGLDNVRVHDSAVSNVSGRVYLTGGGSPNGRSEVSEEPTGLTVERVALDDFEGPVPDVVKIDVEGHEGEVLAGMERLLRRHRPVIFCEIHGDGAGIKESLIGRGYAVERLDYRFDGNEFVRASANE